MKLGNIAARVLGAAACIGLAAGVIQPAAAGPAQVYMDENGGVWWELNTPNNGGTLNVKHAGSVTSKAFSRSEDPHLAGPLDDGHYWYELTLYPVIDAETMAAARKARSKGDDQAAMKLIQASGSAPMDEMTQTGGFYIDGGYLVDGGARE